MAELSNVQKERRRFRHYSWSGALLVAAIAATANFVISYVPIRLDISSGGVYSISAGSKEILKKLDDTLVVKVVFSSQLPAVYKLNQTYLTDLLSEYKRASHGKIRVEYVDPSQSPKAREEAIGLGIAPVQLDVRERDRREVKECFMGVGFLYGDKREAIPIVQDTANLEYDVTVRFKRLLVPEKTTLGFISNGGALTMASQSLQTLAGPLRQLYEVEDVDLSKPVPPAVKALWLIAPTAPLDDKMIANLNDYANAGGFLGLLLNRVDVQIERFSGSPVNPGLDEFLAGWGLKLRDGLVVDQSCDRIQVQAVQGAYRMINVIDYPYFPWSSDLDRKHPATKNLDGVSMPFVSPIEALQASAGITYTSLVRSSPLSFLNERPLDLNPLKEPQALPNAPRGPFNLGVLAEKGASRLVLFGTSRFIQSEYPSRPSNLGMFGNLIDWSTQDEALIQIRSKGLARRPLKEFPDVVRMAFKYLMVLALPLFSLALGLWVWRAQRTRRALLPLRYKES